MVTADKREGLTLRGQTETEKREHARPVTIFRSIDTQSSMTLMTTLYNKTLVFCLQRTSEKNAGFLTTAFVGEKRWFPDHSVRRNRTLVSCPQRTSRKN